MHVVGLITKFSLISLITSVGSQTMLSAIISVVIKQDLKNEELHDVMIMRIMMMKDGNLKVETGRALQDPTPGKCTPEAASLVAQPRLCRLRPVRDCPLTQPLNCTNHMPCLWATVNRRNLQIFRIESVGCSPGRGPFLGKGEELGLSRNAADSQLGVSRYDQTPRGSGDVEDLFYELVKGCHMRPRGCSYVVCTRSTLQGFEIDSNRCLLIRYEHGCIMSDLRQ